MIDPGELLHHQEFVRAVARRLLLDENGVDDVVQETWLAALRNPPPDRGRLRGWLAVVARNFALKRHREEHRRARREFARAKGEKLPAAGDVVAEMETSRLVVDAVLALDEPYRTTVLLRYFRGMPSHRVAKEMDVPAPTVRTRLRRALQLLRDRLDRRAYGVALLALAFAPRRLALLPFATAATVLVAGAATVVLSSRAEPPRRTPPALALTRLPSPDAPAPAVAGAPARATKKKPLPPVPRGVIEGRVVGVDDEPIPGGRAYLLRYYDYQQLPLPWIAEDGVAQAEVGADGVFTFRGLPRGRYALAVAVDGRPLREGLAPAGERIVFRFGDAAVTGKALDPVGRPAVGGLVQINRHASRVSVWAEVGADGNYFADALPAGDYWIALNRKGHGRTDGAALTRRVALAAEETTALDLGRGTPLPRWRGVLRDARGEPFGPARLQLNVAGAEDGYAFVDVGGDGGFVASFLPGRYEVFAHLPGRRFVPLGEFNLTETDRFEDLAFAGARVRGRLPGADWVRLNGMDWARTNDGAFLLAGIPPGKYLLERRPGAPQVAVEVAPEAVEVVLE